MQDRSEHLQWCKDRANAYLKRNNHSLALGSFVSDMSKHPELYNHLALHIGSKLLIQGKLSTVQEVKDWIEGFN